MVKRPPTPVGYPHDYFGSEGPLSPPDCFDPDPTPRKGPDSPLRVALNDWTRILLPDCYLLSASPLAKGVDSIENTRFNPSSHWRRV